MKKTLLRLFVLSLAATSLVGCEFLSGDDSNIDYITVRNYKTAALLNSNYKFDGQVYAVFKDKTEEDITSNVTYSTLDTSSLRDDAKFKVSYETKTKIYSKTVSIKIVESIYLEKLTIEEYSETAEVGVEYVFDGKVSAKYVDGTSKDVSEYAIASPLDVSREGTSQLVVSYTEDGITKSDIKPVEVLNLVKSIKIIDQTTTYVLGDEFKFDGSVRAIYSDGTFSDVTEKISVDSSEINTNELGNYTLKASYNDGDLHFEDSVQIYVLTHIPNLVEISASEYTSQIDKRVTYVFDGLVTATFDEGPSMDVTKSCTFSTISTQQGGVKDLTISYTDPRTNIKRSTVVQIEVISHVSGIELPEKVKIKTGGTAELDPLVSPSDATDKGLTFSSSDTSVATIDENGLISGLKAGTSIITVTSIENPSVSSTTTVNVSDVLLADWSIFLYVCGADLESYSSEATADLYEIDSVRGKTDDVNIVVEAGGASNWNSYYSSIINKDKLNRFHLTGGSYVEDEQIESANMGLASTLESFLEWGIGKYPADQYALILWNHGGGLSGCCNDEIYGDGLTNDEVVLAVDEAFSKTGVSKFDWIGYDCCLMQTMEVAEFNSQYFNYQVASQEVESGYGWAYDGWIGNVYKKKSTETILASIVDSFISQFGGVDVDSAGANQTLSYLDLSKMSDFKNAWETLANKTKIIINYENKTKFWTEIILKTHYFGGSTYYGAFDVYDYLQKLKTNLDSAFNPGNEYIKAVETSLSALVKRNKAQKGGSADAHGLSFYFGSGYNESRYSNFSEWISLVDSIIYF